MAALNRSVESTFWMILSTFYFMKHEVTTVALPGLIARSRFSHGGVGRCAAVLGVGFDAIPPNHENDAARVFDAGKEVDAV
jgi:hypothetical protein